MVIIKHASFFWRAHSHIAARYVLFQDMQDMLVFWWFGCIFFVFGYQFKENMQLRCVALFWN